MAEAELERREDGEEKQKPRSSKYWLSELAAAHERVKPWHKRGEAVLKRYTDENDGRTSTNKVNILWSNTEVLEAALYGNSAKPDVRRRFPDRSDPIKRLVAEVLERSISYTCDQYGLDTAVELFLKDALLPGMGVLWVRYEPQLNDDDEISYQEVEVDHLHWKDFRWGAARCWRDVPWVARLHILKRDQLEEAFGKAAKDVPLNHKEEGAPKDDDSDVYKRAEVWEIWSKARRERLYVVEGHELILKQDADPYGLRDFFPCPEPLILVRKPGTLIPIPMFTLYQDQAEQLDTLSTRIYHLTDNLRYRGIYDASEQQDSKFGDLAHAQDGEFLPARDFSALREGSRSGNAIDAVFAAEPIKERAEVIDRLRQQAVDLIQTIYELTGISDIIRGSSDPNETATAQRLKGQFGTMRLNRMQKAVQHVIRDVFRIKAELIAEHYTPEVLASITGIQIPTEEEVGQAQQALQNVQFMGMPRDPEGQQRLQQARALLQEPNWPAVMQILRSDERRNYAVDVETDSTVLQDEQADKQARNEFMQAFQQLLGNGIPVIKETPEIIPLFKEMVMFALRGFHIARTMEETVEDTFEQLQESMAQQDKPDPETIKAAAEAEKIKREQDREDERLRLDATDQANDHDIAQKEVAIKAVDEARQIKEAEIDARMREGELNAERAQGQVFNGPAQ